MARTGDSQANSDPDADPDPNASAQTPGARLRAAMDAGCVAAPGAFNGLVARAVARAGFQAAYVSGGATSAAAGVPDVGLLTLDRFAATVREVVDGTRQGPGRAPLPVLADADTGFGEEEMARRTVLEYQRAGAAGLHMEDQVFPKRCGHLDGKALIEADHAAAKIAWAVEAAADSADPAFVVCARTDARGVSGLASAIDRGHRYASAGAAMLFPEGLTSREELAQFARAMATARVGGDGPRPYLLANMTEFGKTPMLTLADFAELGYDLVIFPVSTLRAAMGAVERLLEALARDGTVHAQLEAMQTRRGLYDLLGYAPGEPWRFR